MSADIYHFDSENETLIVNKKNKKKTKSYEMETPKGEMVNEIYNQISNIINSNNFQNNNHLNKQLNKQIYDPFDTPDEDSDIEDDLFKLNDSNTIICNDCKGEMYYSTRGLECNKCGRIDETEEESEKNTSAEAIYEYNTSDTSAVPVRISGPNNYMFQKNLVSHTSNYKKMQRKTTIDQMINCVYRYKGSAPPKNIILEAAELYYSVQQHCIKRGDVRKGTMAACLYRVCMNNNITRKPKEISDIFCIPQGELSNGEKVLDELIASGLIKIKDRENIQEATEENDEKIEEKQTHAFLNRYFECLNIPVDEPGSTIIGRPNYKEFAIRLIKFTKKYRIADSSILSSKCAGAIYIISTRRKELQLKRDQIEKECCISKSTFSRFSQAVLTVLNTNEEKYQKVKSRLRNLFKKYQLPII